MSNEIYPISLTREALVELFNRVVRDDFEDSSSQSRLLWSAQYFKRTFRIGHAKLTETEFRDLRAFYSLRSGLHDTFWFRDNLNRGGNALVRFSQALSLRRSSPLVDVDVVLEEASAIRALPELAEVTTAAGMAPLVWYDPNRERRILHIASVITEDSAFDGAGENYPGVWQAGSLPLFNYAAQYQDYSWDGTAWGKSAGNVSELSTTQPACTIFMLVKHGTSAADQVMISVGGTGTNESMSLMIDSSNQYRPGINKTPVAGAAISNSPIDTWISLAARWDTASNDVTLRKNVSTLSGTGTATRAYAAGPISFGAWLDGTALCDASTGHHIAHAMIFPAFLSVAQLTALHNLFAYQYGIATV